MAPALIEAVKESNETYKDDFAGLKQEKQALKGQLIEITSSLNSIKELLNIDQGSETVNSKK